jgi:hypothetical protein
VVSQIYVERIRNENGHDFLLREAAREQLLITGDGRLQVLYKGVVQHRIKWEAVA